MTFKQLIQLLPKVVRYNLEDYICQEVFSGFCWLHLAFLLFSCFRMPGNGRRLTRDSSIAS